MLLVLVIVLTTICTATARDTMGHRQFATDTLSTDDEFEGRPTAIQLYNPSYDDQALVPHSSHGDALLSRLQSTGSSLWEKRDWADRAQSLLAQPVHSTNDASGLRGMTGMMTNCDGW